jgi:hypothetical protein
MNSWEKIDDYWQRTFFMLPAYILCLIIAILTGLIFHRKTKLGWLFLLYLLLDLIILFLDGYVGYFLDWPRKNVAVFRSITNALIIFVELNVYLYFFSQVIKSQKIKKSLSLLKAAFLIVIVLFGINCFHILRFIPINKFGHYIGALEFLILLLPSFVFYSELLSSNLKEDILKRPSFWITTGIFLLSILSIPFYLIDYYLTVNNLPYLDNFAGILFYTPLSFNYLLLSKAFVCKKVLTA